MRITPIVNRNFMFRYKQLSNRIVDTLTGAEYLQASTVKASNLLDRLNRIGLKNAEIIDRTGTQNNLFSIVA